MGIETGYAGIGYHAIDVVKSIQLARVVARNRLLRAGGCDRDSVNALHYILLDEHLETL